MRAKRPIGSQPEELRPLLVVSALPLAGLVLSLLAIWIAAMPGPQHSVSLDITGCFPRPGVEESVVHTIEIDFDGSMLWDGQAMPSRAALEARLQAVGALALSDQPEVHVKPHKQAGYGAVTAVLAAVQRHGVRKMGLIGSDFAVIQSGCVAI